MLLAAVRWRLLDWKISARRLFAWHLLLVAALATINVVVGQRDGDGPPSTFFRMAFEANLPTFVSVMALLLTTLVALRLAFIQDRAEGRGWALFAVAFTVMTIDEAAQIHEKLNSLGDRDAGVFSSIGVLPYAVVALVLGVWLFKFWLRQSLSVRLSLAAGGLIYLGSAVGVEMVQNIERARGVSQTLPHMLALVTLEESGEMLAVAILLQAFLARLRELGATEILTIGLSTTSVPVRGPQPGE